MRWDGDLVASSVEGRYPSSGMPSREGSIHIGTPGALLELAIVVVSAARLWKVEDEAVLYSCPGKPDGRVSRSAMVVMGKQQEGGERPILSREVRELAAHMLGGGV